MPQLGPVPAQREPQSIIYSVTTRIVVLTLTILVTVGILATLGLAQRERDHLVAAKQLAVTMTTELFAETVAVALDLGDERDVAERMEPLRSNASMTYAAVWKNSPSQPIGELGHRPKGGPSFETTGLSRNGDYLTVVRPILGATRNTIGYAGVQVSLEPENRAFRASRSRIAISAFLTVGVTFLCLFVALRWGIVTRIHQVVEAARRLELGQHVRAKVHGRDELGQLGAAFNSMADAIVEREYRVANARRRLQTLLDHMGQAIITFDARGKVLGDRSRQAEQLFGPTLIEGASIVSLLYPEGRDQVVESESFSAWIDAAFEREGIDWSELEALAPSSVTLMRSSGHIHELDLEFRWVESNDAPNCVMMIATDATQRRRLERVMDQAESDHKKAVAALRWLVSGGGQLFVRFLESSRSRLAMAIRSMSLSQSLDAEVLGQVFRDVHTVRAEARCFDLERVDQTLTQVEMQLAEVRGGAITTPAAIAQQREVMLRWLEFANVELEKAERQFVERSPIGREVLDQMTVRRSDVSRFTQLTAGRKDELAKLASAMTSRPFGETVVTVVDAASRWAERVGKHVKTEVSGADRRVPGRLAERLPGILSHLVRNSIAHGIEVSSLRIEKGKPAIGTIRISCEGAEDAPIISVQDDGAGLDIGGLGNGDEGQAAHAALQPGITTYAQPTPFAGFGVGLDAVQKDLLGIGYEVTLNQEPNAGASVTLKPKRQRTLT